MAEMARKKSLIIKILQVFFGEGNRGNTQVQFTSYEKDFYKKNFTPKNYISLPIIETNTYDTRIDLSNSRTE